MAKRNKRSRQKARTPTIQNSGYSNGGASHESNILKSLQSAKIFRKIRRKCQSIYVAQPQCRPVYQYAYRCGGYHDQLIAYDWGGITFISATQV